MALTSSVHIETALRAGRTILKASFCEAPFKIADVTEDKQRVTLVLMLMCSSPGVLDGDEYNLNLCLAEGTSLALQTQSYQRIFQMKKGASQCMNVRMERGASFIYLPHPAVPHKEAIFGLRNRIELSGGCTLVWGEVICCGRKLNDEVFAFTSYGSRTEIFLNDKLVVKENLLIVPSAMNVDALGRMEGYTHQATLFYLNETLTVTEWSEDAFQLLDAQENISFGISTLPVNGVVVRLLGYKAEHLFGLLKGLQRLTHPFAHLCNTKTTADD